MGTVAIREIRQEDNVEVAGMIRHVLVEMGVPKVGTAYADKALDSMFENYNVPNADYFVVVEDEEIIGSAGIAQLENFEGNVCELQKMYFTEKARGRGLGSIMMAICLERARAYGYGKCYLETLPYMEAAQKLYRKTGFSYLDGPLGDTGHYSCTVWMLLDL
ncbi:MAG: GNAT family N-acetyltransferase [Sediminicola sp.]|tara:strand:+ start:24747 stop:25232 length:486 start_codon:yes stop_codon:yes gene_type:complete